MTSLVVTLFCACFLSELLKTSTRTDAAFCVLTGSSCSFLFPFHKLSHFYVSVPFETERSCCECLTFVKPIGIWNINPGTATISWRSTIRSCTLMTTKWRSASFLWFPHPAALWNGTGGVNGGYPKHSFCRFIAIYALSWHFNPCRACVTCWVPALFVWFDYKSSLANFPALSPAEVILTFSVCILCPGTVMSNTFGMSLPSCKTRHLMSLSLFIRFLAFV